MTARPTERVLDASGLRALAHPLRMRMLALLRSEGPATATRLAERLGESSGTTSWHLRQLAQHGFIEEDLQRGNRRDRWWRAAQQSTRVESTDAFHADPGTSAAIGTYLREVVSSYFRRAADFLDEEAEWNERGWSESATVSDWRLQLTAVEARDLLRRIEQLVESYRHERREGGETYVVQIQGFPTRPPA